MPAKKAAKKVAEKAPAKKAAKKAARKAPAAKPAKKAAGRSADHIRVAAYLNYRSRVEQGLPGDHIGDWLAAEKSPDV